MSSDIAKPDFYPEPITVVNAEKRHNPPTQQSEINYCFYIIQSTLNLIAHILIGFIVAISLLFAIKIGSPLPLGPTPTHIILCVMGYQLLMAESILCLSPNNGWSSKLRLVDKYRAHWILQMLGSGMALAGSFIKIMDKKIHWNTYHGQFGLVAMVFTVACFFNGLTALYAYEYRKYFNGIISKLTHICFGVIAFAASNISLCYGFDYERFRIWATTEYADAIIAFTAIFTIIIIINPCITFYIKTLAAAKK